MIPDWLWTSNGNWAAWAVVVPVVTAILVGVTIWRNNDND